jgi:hypothetical protein
MELFEIENNGSSIPRQIKWQVPHEEVLKFNIAYILLVISDNFAGWGCDRVIETIVVR